jgi:hypothetical protein
MSLSVQWLKIKKSIAVVEVDCTSMNNIINAFDTLQSYLHSINTASVS